MARIDLKRLGFNGALVFVLFILISPVLILIVEMYFALEFELSPAIAAMSVYLVAIVVVGLIIIDRTVGLENINFAGTGN